MRSGFSFSRAIAIVFATLTTTAGLAAGQAFSAPGQGVNDWRDEPNVEEPGTIPYDWYGDVSADYPADSNGIGVARTGESARVLNVKWVTFAYPVSFTATSVSMAGLGVVDSVALLRQFNAGPYMLPGPRIWLAFYGDWADMNEDGFREEHQGLNRVGGGHDRVVYVRGGDEDCAQTATPATDDPNGLALTVAGNRVPTGVSWRCTIEDEWAGVDGNTIIGYVTPGPAGGFSLPRLALLTGNPTNASRNADLVFASGGNLHGNGTYYSPASYLDTTLVDGSILETTVTEVFSDAQLTPNGARQYEPGEASKIDVDKYISVSGDLEKLYQETLWTLPGVWNPPVDDANRRVAELNPSEDAFAEIDPRVGPTQAQYQPPNPIEDTGYNHTAAFHMYLDLKVVESSSYSAVGAGGRPLVTNWVSPTGTGAAQFGARIDVWGRYGAWFDKNGDGFVGAPTATRGCSDAYDCGTVQDPNNYAVSEEWKPTCLPGATGRFWVTLTTADGSWGPVGAYVVTDEDSRADGRRNFDPYTGAVIDASDGSVDRLVTNGPVRLMVVCTSSNGNYYSFEQVVLPGGNHGLDITMTSDPISQEFVAAGILIPETSQDTDFYPGWAL